MKPNNVRAVYTDALEMLFSNRNKDYGAYYLRREYPNTMLKALGGATLLIFLGVLASWVEPSKKTEKDEIGVVCILNDIPIEKPKEVIPEKPEPPKPPPVRTTVKVVPPRIVDNSVTETEPPTATAEIPDNVNIGKFNQKGDPDAVPTLDPDPIPDPGPVEDQGKGADDGENDPPSFVEMMPAFPGGEVEMMKYLSENIKYPALAKEIGAKGRVIVQFVVRKDGRLSDFVIVRDIGSGCGKEALRVIKQMPPWMPGQQNGVPVSVKLTVPVLFQLE